MNKKQIPMKVWLLQIQFTECSIGKYSVQINGVISLKFRNWTVER